MNEAIARSRAENVFQIGEDDSDEEQKTDQLLDPEQVNNKKKLKQAAKDRQEKQTKNAIEIEEEEKVPNPEQQDGEIEEEDQYEDIVLERRDPPEQQVQVNEVASLTNRVTPRGREEAQ